MERFVEIEGLDLFAASPVLREKVDSQSESQGDRYRRTLHRSADRKPWQYPLSGLRWMPANPACDDYGSANPPMPSGPKSVGGQVHHEFPTTGRSLEREVS